VKVPQELKPDGADIAPLLSGTMSEAAFQPHPIYSVSPGFKSRMVRNGPWKLVEGGTGKAKKKADAAGKGETRELFNLDQDMREENNVIATQPKIAEELTALLAKFAQDDKPSSKAAKD